MKASGRVHARPLGGPVGPSWGSGLRAAYDDAGPHVHFEWHLDGGPAVDPYDFLMLVCSRATCGRRKAGLARVSPAFRVRVLFAAYPFG